MRLEDDEAAVVCRDCNSYLHATVREGGSVVLVRCPYRVFDGLKQECKPPMEQRYGRS